MKKIYVLLALSLLSLSCKTSDDDTENMASLVGDWKMSKAEVVSGSNNAVLYSQTLEGCDASTTFAFSTDGSYSLKFYQEQNNQCEFDYEDKGLYNYDRTAQTIVTKRSNTSHMEIYKVEKLTDSELVLSLYDDYDQNQDGVEDKNVYYLRR